MCDGLDVARWGEKMDIRIYQFIMALGLTVAFSSSFALAGAGSSGGGSAVVCRNAAKKIISAELLDLYEGRMRFGFAYGPVHPDANLQLETALKKLNSPYNQALTREIAADVLQRLIFLPPSVVLAPGNDLGDEYGVVVEDGCQIEGVGFYEFDGTLKVAQPIYRAFSQMSRAAFILHEAIYKIARESSSVTSSALPRKLTAALFASNTNQKLVAELVKTQYFVNSFDYHTINGGSSLAVPTIAELVLPSKFTKINIRGMCDTPGVYPCTGIAFECLNLKNEVIETVSNFFRNTDGTLGWTTNVTLQSACTRIAFGSDSHATQVYFHDNGHPFWSIKVPQEIGWAGVVNLAYETIVPTIPVLP
jgi:hypothetical protein